jgi:membrane protease YdiL (CAAX protease family)
MRKRTNAPEGQDMNTESSAPNSGPVPTPVQPEPPEQRPSRLRRMFIGSAGLRAGWRFAIFVVLFMVFASIALSLLVHFSEFGKLRKAAVAGTLTPTYLIVFEIVQFGTALLAAAIMCRIERADFRSYGIPLRGAFGKNFWIGLFWGLAFMSIELGAMKGLGGFSFGGLAIAGSAIAKYAAVWAVGFVLVGFAEEFVFRGYTLYTLSTGLGFWPAAILLSAAFGAVHLSNTGEDWAGAASVFVFGLFACFTLRRTGSLWFAIGFHAAGDYAESFIYSVPDSGTLATGHLLHSSFHGPAWLTGGTVGPEASVLNFAVFALSFILFAWMFPRKQAEPQS